MFSGFVSKPTINPGLGVVPSPPEQEGLGWGSRWPRGLSCGRAHFHRERRSSLRTRSPERRTALSSRPSTHTPHPPSELTARRPGLWVPRSGVRRAHAASTSMFAFPVPARLGDTLVCPSWHSAGTSIWPEGQGECVLPRPSGNDGGLRSGSVRGANRCLQLHESGRRNRLSAGITQENYPFPGGTAPGGQAWEPRRGSCGAPPRSAPTPGTRTEHSPSEGARRRRRGRPPILSDAAPARVSPYGSAWREAERRREPRPPRLFSGRFSAVTLSGQALG